MQDDKTVGEGDRSEPRALTERLFPFLPISNNCDKERRSINYVTRFMLVYDPFEYYL